jgi:hypothetical protein
VQRPHRAAYVFAVIMPVILLAVLAVPLGVAWTIARVRQGSSSVTTQAQSNSKATDGNPGLGDPYYPQAGNSGYDVTKYQIMINWDLTTQTLTGTTTISARAIQQLNSFYFDLVLKTNRVTVNGAPAQFVQKGFSDVYVKPGNPIPAGGTFQVVVVYAGKPADYKQSDAHPWWSSDGEWTAAGEPESSAWWYPANDQPGGAQPAPSQQAVQRPHRAAYVVLVGAGSEDWEANGRQNEFGRHSTMGKSPRRRCRVCWTQPAIRRPTSRAQRICGH